jgi:hypothetical protein
MCALFSCPSIRAQKDGHLFSPAVFIPAQRKAANVTELSMLVLDYDHDARLLQDLRPWIALGVRLGVYTSHSRNVAHVTAVTFTGKRHHRFEGLVGAT